MTIRRRDATAFLIFAAPWALHAQPVPRVIKFAMQNPPGSAQHDAALKFAEIVKAQSVGKLQVQVFGGGTLGKDVAVVAALQGGTVEMALMSASLLSGLVRQMSVFDLPFVFASEAEAYAVVDGPFGKKLHGLLDAKGLVGLNYWEAGATHFHSGKRPFERLEDFQGVTIRAIETPVAIDFISALGANPVPVPFPELYGALEQKVVDGGTAPVIVMLNARLYEVQKYASLSGHMVLVQSLLFSKKAWDSYSADERSLLQAAADEARGVERQLARERNAKALAELKARGMSINQLPASELARMKARAQPVIDKHTKAIGAGTVADLHAAIARVREKD